MFQHWTTPFRREASGESVMNHLRAICQHHRIQASPGYRDAANYCLERLLTYGLDAKIVRYPASPDVYFGNWRSFREWHCREAELTLIAPHEKRLASYTHNEMTIIQRSTATPPEGITAELVCIDRPLDDASYAQIDVRGKIVLATARPKDLFEIAVKKYGAAGIVSDFMVSFPPVRTPEDLYDAVQYMSFWWHADEETGFGFAVSPRVGQELRDLCTKGTVTVHARVDADLYEGELENVEAFIPGETEEEVLLVSHLCHPKPGANDNASGPSTLLETARILARLIREGKVQKPRRGLRFLLMPEMTGTHAYVQAYPERVKRTVAALNLDMVGADYRKGGGPLTVEKPTRALPSFVGELAYAIYSELAADAGSFSGGARYATSPHVFTPFSGGSDHYILADPSVGIPTPMMITWPDKYYHTDADRPEHIDPALMERVAATAATYLHWIANAELRDIVSLAGRMTSLFAGELERVIGQFCDGELAFSQAEARLQYLHKRQKADLASLAVLVRPDDLAAWRTALDRHTAMLESHHTFQQGELHILHECGHDGKEEPAASVHDDPLLDQIFIRRFSGPIALDGYLDRLTPEEAAAWKGAESRCAAPGLLPTLLQYWLDGTRTLREVITAVELESGVADTEYALAFVRLLKRLDLVK
ncbi:DUF4910 domain-containing protein [Tumebacillus sp. DT12]|uniref:DUF4910 domain-containing protein n=1 Tax=Tumebacillus lacus TaxID=2995335 RepID=A0ABT3X228_9BACL|nr:DUF4910 domain-containing protein [Tumebacillus lacus]MCX7570978.1 DUF4910 domain-containing protein [Tumebacillus lacus]